jgi:hypothetical protein
MVCHVAARKAHQRLYKISFVIPERLLQKYPHFSDVPGRPDDVRSPGEDQEWSAEGQNDAIDPTRTSESLFFDRIVCATSWPI